jgi:hypothetical protein
MDRKWRSLGVELSLLDVLVGVGCEVFFFVLLLDWEWEVINLALLRGTD